MYEEVEGGKANFESLQFKGEMRVDLLRKAFHILEHSPQYARGSR